MNMVSAEDLARMMASKHGMEEREAKLFVEDFFKTIRNVLHTEKSLKMKGLGTFSTIMVRSESEPGRKFKMMTFSPDAKLAKSVNRPFEQFETVTLADGVSFEDVTEEIGDDNLLKNSAKNDMPVDELPVADSWLLMDEQETPVVQITPVDVVEQETGGASAAEPAAVSPAEDTVDEPVDTSAKNGTGEEDAQPAVRQHRRWIWVAGAAVAVGLLAMHFLMKPGKNEMDADKQLARTETADTVQTVAPAQLSPEEQFVKENEMVAVGAYRIVGVDTVITVTRGLTLQRIATIFLGSEMQDYLIAMNGGNDNPQEGDRYKIPKLELKK